METVALNWQRGTEGKVWAKKKNTEGAVVREKERSRQCTAQEMAMARDGATELEAITR